jgi:uncharacterized protein YqjF (DUF2071 family)
MNFLSCEWRKLAIANYAIYPSLLKKHLPYKTELDLRNNICYVSLVAFMFCNTKTLGIKIPFHTNFEEVNLRFYVKHQDESKQWKRGVVFIKEIVPKPALAFFARSLYNENYVSMPMNHFWDLNKDYLSVDYSWKGDTLNTFHIKSAAETEIIKPESEEEFIFEHYWGYTKVSEQKTFEYQVEHPSWKIYPVLDFAIDVDFGKLYGSEFEFLKNEKPASVFLAEGSEVNVKSKRTI